MDFVIAIPSYQRTNVLQEKTLSLLRNHNIPKDHIYIFVANEEEREEYAKIPHTLYGHLVVGVKGIREQRNFIFDYFDSEQHCVCLDDDVEEVLTVEEDRWVPCESLLTLIQRGFADCAELGSAAWGLYPCANKMFMKNSKPITVGWRFLIGNCFGIILDKEFKMTCEMKEDYELSLWYAKKYGNVIRYNHYVAKTKIGAKGGIGKKTADRLETYKKAIDILKAEYPEHVRLNKRREGEILIV